eukprot:7241648-Prorocentrum_lima.AAC.1
MPLLFAFATDAFPSALLFPFPLLRPLPGMGLVARPLLPGVWGGEGGGGDTPPRDPSDSDIVFPVVLNGPMVQRWSRCGLVVV